MEPLQAFLLALLATVGLAISSYFLLVYYGIARPDASWIPRVCRMEKGSCDSILQTRQGKLFGVPNFYPGLLFYLAVFGTAILRVPQEVVILVQAGSGLTLLLGAYLSYSLLVDLKVRCVLCFSAHGVNVLIFLLLVFP